MKERGCTILPPMDNGISSFRIAQWYGGLREFSCRISSAGPSVFLWLHGYTPEDIEQIVVMERLRLNNQGLSCGAKAIRGNLIKDGIKLLPSVSTIGRILSKITSPVAARGIIRRIMLGGEDGMIFTPIMGNYSFLDPTSVTAKIAWDLIGNISWDETK
jgi:hypothetical protein